VNFPKYKKGECTAKPVKAEPTFRESQALFEIPPSQTMYKQYVKLK